MHIILFDFFIHKNSKLEWATKYYLINLLHFFHNILFYKQSNWKMYLFLYQIFYKIILLFKNYRCHPLIMKYHCPSLMMNQKNYWNSQAMSILIYFNLKLFFMLAKLLKIFFLILLQFWGIFEKLQVPDFLWKVFYRFFVLNNFAKSFISVYLHLITLVEFCFLINFVQLFQKLFLETLVIHQKLFLNVCLLLFFPYCIIKIYEFFN